MALLAVDGLQVEYRTAHGTVRAVDGASFEVPDGAIVGLVGESGCGKTTVARAIMGVMPRNAAIVGGAIGFNGRDLLRLTHRDYVGLRWRQLAFVPQSAMNSFDPVYRVGAQVVEVLRRRGGQNRTAARRRAEALFDMVGLDPRRLADYPHQFSGGMRQRAAIALALALEPQLIIADEPVTALDVIVQRQVLDTIGALQRRLGTSVILVTHDISVIAYVCDRVVVMYAGTVVERGSTGAVLERPSHPYTMGLCNAFPDLERSAGILVPIEGSPPDLRGASTGCRFAPRCPFAIERCHDAAPPIAASDPGHDAACWRLGESAALRALAQDPRTWLRS
jgi:peptide/nickel transport system ATP-binding protein